jgi:MFS family permease
VLFDFLMLMLSKERTIAPSSFNRWLVPPAALAVHLSIGMAYGFSVFWLPLSRAIGITAPAPGDWPIKTLSWMFTLFFVFLGSSAAIFGQWVEREGPRKAGVVAACCWGGGFFISALGIHLHQIALLWIGSGVIGGCGLGLGYISPVSTLIKWFPDRRGMATGLAIMGFGGGAMIGSPLADLLMRHFSSPTSVGVWQTFVVLGTIYFIAMLIGSFGYRLPAPGWRPAGWTPPAAAAASAQRFVPVAIAWKTPQFWLLWSVLCLNVTAGIGVLDMASPMIQEVFRGRVNATEAAGFVGLLSLFNILGRIFWASMSDFVGRRWTYSIFFLLGIGLYASVPLIGASGSLALFVVTFCVVLSMYGGGFSTIPAYLADVFGVGEVAAIHGRILTAWSTAGVLGPVLIGYVRESQIAHGVPPGRAYDVTMYVLVGLLVVGLICNLAVRPMAASAFVGDTAKMDASNTRPAVAATPAPTTPVGNWGWVAVAWVLIGIPLSWGIMRTMTSASRLFR